MKYAFCHLRKPLLKNGSLKNNMKSDERPLFQAESDRLDKNLNTSKCESEKWVVVPDIMFLVIANFLQQNPHFGPLSRPVEVLL